MMTTLLITARAFDDVTRLAYSLYRSCDNWVGPVQQCEANADSWAYLTQILPSSYGVDRVKISVIRRFGPRATSHCAGHSLTGN